MIISEEKDYFIYGCITTVFIESVLCIIYGCCCENQISRFNYERCVNWCCRREHSTRGLLDDDLIYSNTNDADITNSFENLADSPTNRSETLFIDL